MKKITAIVLVAALSACASNAEKMKTTLDQNYSSIVKKVSAKERQCPRNTATTYMVCWGSAIDDALIETKFPIMTGVPLRSQFGMIGEAVDSGQMSTNEADTRAYQIINYEISGGYNSAIGRAKQKDDALTAVLLGLGANIQRQQAINALQAQANQPKIVQRPVTNFDCRNYAYGVRCNGY